MKALKFFCVLSLLYSGQAIAANLHKDSPVNKGREAKLEKSILPASKTNLLKLLVFDVAAVTLKPDTSLTNAIKPDFDSLILPENKLWLKKSEK